MIKKRWQRPLFIALFIFGLLVSTQYKTQQALLSDLAFQEQEDLVAIVKNLNESRSKLETEVDNLNKTKHTVETKAEQGASLYTTLDNELKQLELITGTTPVSGPGVTVTITGDSNLQYYDLIDLVNELWVSGAEIIAINNYRIEATTKIYHDLDLKNRPIITINGQPLLSPVVIKALGDADTLEKGLTFTGGIIDNLNTLFGVYPIVKKEETINIPAIADHTSYQYLN